MISNTRLTLNLQYPNIAQVAYAMQGDRLSRAVVADLIDGSTPWAPPAGAYGLITASKPDGTFAVYDTLEDGSPAIVIDGSTVTLYLAEQVLADAGAVKMSVAFFTSAGARLTTFRWTEVVAPEAVLDRVVSGNYISILTAAMAQAADDLEEAQTIFDQIKAAYGAPLTAATAAAMTDTSRVYVYTGTTGGGFTNGHWYYWNGSAWTDGGVYNSTAFETDPTLTIAGAAADAKAAGDAVGDLKSAYNDDYSSLRWSKSADKGISYTNGEEVASSAFSCTGYVFVAPFARIKYMRVATTGGISTGLAFYDGNRQFIPNSGIPGLSYQSSNNPVESKADVPQNAMYARFTYRKDTTTYGNFSISGLSKYYSVVKSAGTISDANQLVNRSLQNVLANRVYTITAGAASNLIDAPFGNSSFMLFTGNSSPEVLLDRGFQLAVPGAGVPYQFATRAQQTDMSWSAWDYVPRKIMSDSGRLQPTGDTTDRTAEITNILSNNKVCNLDPGRYYVNNLVMPDDSSIIGSGASTEIYFADNQSGYAIKLGNRCTVKDLTIIGSDTDLDKTAYETLGNRNGVVSYGDNTTAGGPERCSIVNCRIRRFTGAGIHCYRTSAATTNGLCVSDCYIYNCGAGVNIEERSEFHRFTSVYCTHNYYGIINNGGNNYFVNCGLSKNMIGFLIDGTGTHSNSSHGALIGSTLHHEGVSDADPDGIVIKTVGSVAGFVFADLNLSGVISLTDSTRIIFNACNMMSAPPVSIDIENGGSVLFSSCYVRDDIQYNAVNNNKVHFANCFKSDGTIYDPTINP